MSKKANSLLPGFHKLSMHERRQELIDVCSSISLEDFSGLDAPLLTEIVNSMSENVLGSYSLPFSVATNFVVDGLDVLVPMVTEEPSIVAGASKMAKIVAKSGGFVTSVDEPLMKGQLQLFNVSDIDQTEQMFLCHKENLKKKLNDHCPHLVARGGGVERIEHRLIKTAGGQVFFMIEPYINVQDAMGANIVNTLVERLADLVTPLFGAKIGLRILSNFCDERMAAVECTIPFNLLAVDHTHDFGVTIVEKIKLAQDLAQSDVYRACTHNKGVLNGMDALAVATGNDFRAIEAAAHAFACRNGSYGPLTKITIDHDRSILCAELKLPLSVGVVGGIAKVHPTVKFSHKILGSFASSSKKLASLVVSVGLAQCLAALFALSGEGIQQGHMRLHRKKRSVEQKLGTGVNDQS